MAKREVVLTLTPYEENALADLLGYVCAQHPEVLSQIFPRGSHHFELIGRINASLNANRS